jgi:hypothetical protein
MGQECSGCKWIFEEIDIRNRLANQFQSVGDYQFAKIAQEGIRSLVRDWRAHVQRDHGADATSILALSAAVSPESRYSATQTKSQIENAILQLAPPRTEPGDGWPRVDVPVERLSLR